MNIKVAFQMLDINYCTWGTNFCFSDGVELVIRRSYVRLLIGALRFPISEYVGVTH